MRGYILISLLIFVASCSSKWHLKRAIKKDPTILVQDTLTIRDTVITMGVEYRNDTIITRSVDTVEIEKGKLQLKIIRTHDTISVHAKCKPDTIIREIIKPYQRVVYKEKTPRIKYIASTVWGLAALLLAVSFYLLVGGCSL